MKLCNSYVDALIWYQNELRNSLKCMQMIVIDCYYEKMVVSRNDWSLGKIQIVLNAYDCLILRQNNDKMSSQTIAERAVTTVDSLMNISNML